MEGEAESIKSVEEQRKDPTNTDYTICPICGKKFDNPAEASKHVTIEHMQKGEIPE